MYAVIDAVGKQYRVSKADLFSAEKMTVKDGSEVKIEKVLLVTDGDTVQVGNPYLKGACVVCEVVKQMREPKVVAYKYKKRKSEKKKIGHRRDVTVLKVKEIKVAKG